MLVRTAVLALLWVLAISPALAQELEPRAYRVLPTGLNFAAFAYTFSSGNVVVDPSVPIEDLEATIQTGTFGYLRSFGLAGRSASVSLQAPAVYASVSGRFAGEFARGSRFGAADARVKLAVNLLGGPARSPAELAKSPPGRALGVGLTMALPTGQYSSSKLINFGANRFGFKPEIGYSSVRGKRIFEGAAGVWLFTTNHDGFGDTTVRQDPIASVQAHVSYNFRGGVWMGLDANYFSGGRTSVDGVERDDLQQNSRMGFTLSLPLAARQSLKLSAHTGAFTRFGADFDLAAITYQFMWSRGR